MFFNIEKKKKETARVLLLTIHPERRREYGFRTMTRESLQAHCHGDTGPQVNGMFYTMCANTGYATLQLFFGGGGGCVCVFFNELCGRRSMMSE